MAWFVSLFSLLLDEKGYLKIVDFGFAKKLAAEELAYTLCGTPDYLVGTRSRSRRGHAAESTVNTVLLSHLITREFACPVRCSRWSYVRVEPYHLASAAAAIACIPPQVEF
eukprot:1387709-Pyramimonas_sp.AAC.1